MKSFGFLYCFRIHSFWRNCTRLS